MVRVRCIQLLFLPYRITKNHDPENQTKLHFCCLNVTNAFILNFISNPVSIRIHILSERKQV